MSEVMDINATEAIENIIDRSKWTKWKFSDLVDNIVEKVVPRESGLEHYIGLEHLDTGSLKIRRFGETSTLKGDKLKIYKGDLIFAKRNAYLKRVAIADFDAVVSAHSMVLRPNPENVLPEFLPFFLLSEKFWQRAIEISVGSLSPTINWKVLAKQEFLLPPKDQQAQLAKLLWAMDEVIEREKESKGNIAKYLEAVSGRVFSKRVLSFGKELPFEVNSEKWRGCHLDELCELITDGAHASPKTVENGNPIGTVENMRESEIDIESCRRIGDSDFEYLKRNNCKPIIGDVLFSKDGTIGKTFVFNQNEDLVLLSSIAIIRTNKEVLIPEYCSLMLESPVFITEIEKRKSGTALKRVVLKDIKKFRVNLPSIKFQIEISKYLIALKSNISLLNDKIDTSKSLQKSLINQIF